MVRGDEGYEHQGVCSRTAPSMRRMRTIRSAVAPVPVSESFLVCLCCSAICLCGTIADLGG
jgi:hypothetical protein